MGQIFLIMRNELHNTFDVDNVHPDLHKNNYTLFSGNATVFYADTSPKSVEIVSMNSGVESNSILLQLRIRLIRLKLYRIF